MKVYNLKSKGRHMPRQRFQRPEVHRIGAGRKQQWCADYFIYQQQPDGTEQRIHKVGRFGYCSKVAKAKAQGACDTLMASVNSGAVVADASMTLADWWEQFKLVRGSRWSRNTADAYSSTWTVHIEPAVGSIRLADFNKATVDRLLLKLAGAGCGEQLVQRVLMMLHAIFEEAIDNDILLKNPCRKVRLPKCKPAKETRPLTVDEVHRLWGSLDGQDYLVFRVMVLCGLRPNEAFALKREDYTGAAVRVDESVARDGFGPPKNGRTRWTPIPASLKGELDAWLKQRPPDPGALVFTAPRGGVVATRLYGRAILARARKASGIADLTFRQLRTTFGTLFEGDVKDLQTVMGHHSAAFTMDTYRKPLEARAAAATEDLDKRLSNVVEITGKALKVG
ncbi:MAG: site-specific integrase [Bryobacteraceae bacterium]|jgi:integrase